MGTHLVGRRGAGRRLLLVILAVLAALTAAAASATPALALGNPILLTITVAPTVVSVPSGETQQFTATGHYSNLSTQDLTDTVIWSSSSTTTASISNASGSHGLATAAGTGLATIKAADGSVSGTAVLTVLPAMLLTVTVSPTVTSIPLGESVAFTATGHYSDGTTQNMTDTVTWSTSSSAVATVSNASGSQGTVKATGTGAATIDATDPTTSIEGVSAVTVLPAALLLVTVSPLAASIPAGESEQFTATGHYSDGTTNNITDSVTWGTSASGTATVSNTSGTQGEVSAVADGAATITATDPTTSIEGVAAVTVLPAVLVAVTVSPTEASTAEHGSQQFTATGLYSDLSKQNITDSVTWASSDTSEATISNSTGSQGLATGVAPGDVVITATDPSSGFFGIADLDVTGLKLTISPSTGPARTHVTVSGQGFTPGSTVKIIYKTGDATEPRFKICTATVGSDGTFSCTGKIRGPSKAGATGSHTVVAKVPHTHTVTASTSYTLTS